MAVNKTYLTKEGLEELQKEYDNLTKVKRPEVVDRVAEARNMGDLAENAEYVAAREELEFLDGRIDELSELLNNATLISEKPAKSGVSKTVELGSTVELHLGERKEKFTLVGEWEADPAQKKISHVSPLGKALIGKTIGDKVEVEAPAGKIIYTVVSVA